MVTDDNPDGTVPENDMSFQWQVYDIENEEWVNIDNEAWSDTFVVTEDLSGNQIRVMVGYEDVTNGEYTEIASNATGEGNDSAPTETPTQNSTEDSTQDPTEDSTEDSTETPTQDPTEDSAEDSTETPTVSTVDGTKVTTEQVKETRSTVDASGNVTQEEVITEQFTVATVTQNTNETGNEATADVPLFWGESSRTEWATTANIPVGIGLVTSGARAPGVEQTTASALGDLLYYIDTTTPDTDAGKGEMLGGGEDFLKALLSVETLIVNKVTLTTNNTVSVPNVPITINGTANTMATSSGQEAPVEAIVIDASTLTAGTKINLQNVEFAVVVGENLVIRGGEGANIFFSGAGSQNIVLGKDDDQLYAGAGEDIVGSVSGNDTIYGEAGDDTVFGGAGWDTLSGGEGNNLINGGLGYDTALQEGSKSDYTIQIANGTITLTNEVKSSVDMLKDMNEIHFESGEILYVANNDVQQKMLLALGHAKAEILYVPLAQTIAGTDADNIYQLSDNLYGLSVDAKGGNDILNVSGNFNDFRIEQTQTGVEITSLINGTMNELKNFESIIFSDGSDIVIIDNLISLVGSHYPTDAIIG